MRNLTPFVDSEGNMHVHGREGGLASLNFEHEDGTPRVMTDADVFFEVKGFRKQLTPGEVSNQMILTIERGELTPFLNKSVDYVILDETGAVPHVIIQGKLIVTGWS